MINSLQILVICTTLFTVIFSAPVDPKKTGVKNPETQSNNEDMDDYGLEYGRYLQQVVQALEEDKDFASKLANISSDDIKNGKIAHELQFVKHNVRSKLDELKRIEVDRLRKLIQEQMERTELGLYRDEEGRLMPNPDGRRWRTIPGSPGASEHGDGDFWLGLDRKGVKLPSHLDIGNPHSFEISDLKQLIQTATKDLEELDRQRREDFKKYEMEKEFQYRESLKNLTEEERKATEKRHNEMMEKHKDHPKVHHPGSKPQLEQVWEEEDQMPKEEFNPKTFFAMHDTNDDGHLDEKEIEVILRPEVKKMYDVRNVEDDPQEMEEEYHRMREHIFNETDGNRDGLISFEEFMRMTMQQEFEKDDGWKGIDEQNIYSEDELREYAKQKHPDPRLQYQAPNSYQGVPPQINYQGYQPEAQVYQGAPYPQGVPMPQYQGVPPQQQYQGVPPQQQYQGVPPQQQYQGVPSQQQYRAVPQQQQQYQGVPPQQHQAVPPQQHQAVPPQQHQAVPPQQQYQAVPQQQYQPPQQQYQVPQQQYQGSQEPQQQVKYPAQQSNIPGSANVNSQPNVNVPQGQQKVVPAAANEIRNAAEIKDKINPSNIAQPPKI